MIRLTTEFGTLEIEASLIVSVIALLLSAAAFALRVWDRRPRLQVNADCETWYYPDDDEYMGGAPGGILLSIDIVNSSSKKVMVADVIVRWKKSRLSWKWNRYKNILEIADFKANWGDFHRFWVNPWGAEVRNLNCEELQAQLRKRTKDKKVWVLVLVKDVLGRNARSSLMGLELR